MMPLTRAVASANPGPAPGQPGRTGPSRWRRRAPGGVGFGAAVSPLALSPMESPAAPSLVVPLPSPARGSASRVRVGNSELVLEHARGSHALLWSDGRHARRFVLGLEGNGALSVELRAPRLPVQVVPREAITIVPGGRVHGYVLVPLVPTLVWRRADVAQTLLELLPAELRALWDAALGHVHRTTSSWLVRFPVLGGEPRAVVPVRLANRGSEPVCPAHLVLQLDDADLRALRGTIVVRPQRLAWHGDAFFAAVRPPSDPERPV